MSEIKKIAIMTGGGDCPGLNAVIRAAVKTAIMKYGLEVVGIRHGYRGLYLGESEFVPLTLESVSGQISEGGTILFSSNKDNLFDYTYEENGETKRGNVSHVGVENLKKAGVDALVVVGGDGTLTSGRDFARLGVRVIGVPKTIDNDLGATDTTFGFDTAVGVVSECIDRLRTTARSHSRVIVVETMGRYAGFIALNAGIAGGADAILIPEIEYDINKVADHIKKVTSGDKNFAIVVAAEGAKPLDGELAVAKTLDGTGLDNVRLGGISSIVADQLENLTGMESRGANLGHIQRGGTPTANDRILSTRYGSKAIDLLMEGKTGQMVTLAGMEMSYESLENVIDQNKAVDPKGDIVTTAKAIGISFGD